MKALIDWLMQEKQQLLFEFLLALILNIIFLALITLLLWPLDRTALAYRLAKGYVLFWIVLYLSFLILSTIHRIFDVDLYTNVNAFIISNLIVGGFIMAGWSAFAALIFRSSLSGTPTWIGVILFFVGFLSSVIASQVAGFFYQGTIYKFTNLLIACAGFLVFAIWPASGHFIFGRFFDLF